MPATLDHDRSARPRPVFLYGILCAIPLLAWALTGDATKTDVVRKITRNAYVKGYARHAVVRKDCPAIVKDESGATACVDGLLLIPQNRSQRAKLDDFEGETYKVEPVTVMVTNDQGEEERIDADMYLWDGNPGDLLMEPWSLETFEQERLGDWLELFGRMELVGQHSSSDAALSMDEKPD